MRAVRSAALVVTTLVALSSVTAGAGAKPAPHPPKWVQQVVDAIPDITRAEGSVDIEIRAAGQRQSLGVAFTFDRATGYASTDVTTGDNLDEVFTVYTSGTTSWVSLADPAFTNRLPAGKQFVSLETSDLSTIKLFNSGPLLGSDPSIYSAPNYILLGARKSRLKPLEGAGHHVYEFGVDFAAADRSVPESMRAAFEQAYPKVTKGTKAQGSATVDDEHHVLDLEVRFDVPTPAHRIRIAYYLDFRQVNVTVDETLPPDGASVPINSVPGLREELQQATSTPTTNPVTGSS